MIASLIPGSLEAEFKATSTIANKILITKKRNIIPANWDVVWINISFSLQALFVFCWFLLTMYTFNLHTLIVLCSASWCGASWEDLANWLHLNCFSGSSRYSRFDFIAISPHLAPVEYCASLGKNTWNMLVDQIWAKWLVPTNYTK